MESRTSGATSRNTSDVSLGSQRNKIIDGSYGFWDFSFPFFDAMTQDTSIPMFIYYLVAAFIAFQIDYLSMWPRSSEKVNNNGHLYDVLAVVFLGTGSSDNINDLMPSFITTLFFFLLIVITFLVQFFSYFKSRVFLKPIMIAMRIACECVVPIVLTPIATYVGWSLQFYLTKNDSKALVYSIIAAIIYIFMSLIFFILYNVLSTTPFMQRSLLYTWNSRPFFIMMFGQSVFGFLDSFIVNFPPYMRVLMMSSHLIVTVIDLINIYSLFFVNSMATYIFSAILFSAMVYDFLGIVGFWYPINTYYFGTIGIVTYIFGFLLSIFAVRKLTNYIGEKLDLSPEEAEAEYERLNIKANSLRAELFLHTGFKLASERSLDFSLHKYLITNSGDLNIYCECLKIVSCFPQESRLLNQISHGIVKRRDLTFTNRFMLYQIERIKAVRQCQGSTDSNDLFAKLLTCDKLCVEEIHNYWRRIPAELSAVKKISHLITKADNQWKEVLSAYPNNTRFREEYIRYLIEAKSDFTGGIVQKYKIQQIEQNMSFAIDKAFKYFVETFPFYLKDNIIDFKGNILAFGKKHKSSASTSSANSNSSFINSSSNLSAELEENIGKSLFTLSKTRIALQNAFYNRKSSSISLLRLLSFVYLIVLLICSLIVYFQNGNAYDSEVMYGREVACIANMKNSYEELQFYIYAKISFLRGLVDKSANIEDKVITFNNIMNISKLTAFAARDYLKTFETLLTTVSTLSMNGFDAYETVKPFVEDIVPDVYCYNFEPLDPINVSLQESLLHVIDSSFRLLKYMKPSGFTNNPDLCELAANSQTINKYMFQMFDYIKRDAEKTRKNTIRDHQITTFSILICLTVILYPTTMISFFLVYKEISKLIKLMRSFNEQQINECISPVMNDSLNRQKSINIDIDEKTPKFFWRYITITIICLIIPNILTINCGISLFISDELTNSFDWANSSAIRKPLLTESLKSLTLSVMLKVKDATIDPETFKATTAQNELENARKALNQLQRAHKTLTLGDENSAASIGQSKILDNLNDVPSCMLLSENESISKNFLECASITQVFDRLTAILNIHFESLNKLEGQAYFFLENAVFGSFNDKLSASTKAVFDRIEYLKKSHSFWMAAFLAADIVIAFILLCIILYASVYYREIYYVLLRMLLHMPPVMITTNDEVLNFLLKRDTGNDTTNSMTTTRKIIHNSSDPIICLGAGDGIELVNKAVSGLLGYTPEQMLGQNASFIFDQQSYDEVNKQMTFMRSGQSTASYESHVTCITDSDLSVKCRLTLVGMNKDDDGKSTSFVIILRDEGELLRQQTQAEEAKKKSEMLLYQILPMGIVFRLNRGEKNISFSVPSATIIFIDIQKFSDYASSLSPADIMGSLSLMFGAYDSIILKYPLLIKIKLIGDIYMAAAGLFNPEEPPSNHAEQVVRFAIDVLGELEEINNKLSSNLSLRIGVNSGGPLIAGVLGVDKPAFDIIGDPINVAARLQSTDIPGKVQISEATYELVCNAGFSIEKRGEVFLKGKGKSMAYLVSPLAGFTLAMSSAR